MRRIWLKRKSMSNGFHLQACNQPGSMLHRVESNVKWRFEFNQRNRFHFLPLLQFFFSLISIWFFSHLFLCPSFSRNSWRPGRFTMTNDSKRFSRLSFRDAPTASDASVTPSCMMDGPLLSSLLFHFYSFLQYIFCFVWCLSIHFYRELINEFPQLSFSVITVIIHHWWDIIPSW